ncbi:Structural maintenance of chromosomes protein 4 [Dictyocoela roeselum]|nr:Structural maintenance of chromosomes protein 4 [Dictyocoela roeselum]
MIKIKKIIMHNFKSYRGTHTIDNIDTHLNAIVGPNGCGKSNIIDAVLFLFGFRAKKLRHKTATDLIYKPVNNNDAPALCFVDIIFGIGMKDVSMKRILHRSKKSVYQLDGKDVDQQEIRRFLKSHGLDQNRFLILQGEIETIAMLPPKGLAIKSYCVSKNK